ncbi:UNVERIFIED_CONTAM: hypothetical protein Scaly_2918200 [Sesamum calycinum]|uniref:Reverse transcriptase RNase H-like domain-containing protein n=1 Tax=Sesamum calycinum TaxID=2727403 RepID=A0AAW2L0B0_9LAMI
MKKDILFQWDKSCDKAFKSIKSYLMKPLVLVALVPRRHLILYVAAQERSVEILLAQKNDEGKENALYSLSRTMMPNELKYSPIEKLCLALIFSVQKLKHYFPSHSIHLVSKANPLKYVIAKPVLSDKLARWTTVRTPTQATPDALVYGVETVIPLEQQIPSLRIAIQEGLTEEENARIRLEELEALDEKRLEAQQRLKCYQARLSRAFNKKVRLRSFQVGDLVLAVRRPIITTHRTGNKFLPKWAGPYVVKEAYTNGAYKLVAEDGLRISPINWNFLKRYYA